MKHQIIKDKHNNPLFVVVPYTEYCSTMAKITSADGGRIPPEVVELRERKSISLLRAWRMYRRLSVAEVAEKLGIGVRAISKYEALGNKPHTKTVHKLAAIYDCSPSQLV